MPINILAAERARMGELAGKRVCPWHDPERDFIREAQEEAADGFNYCLWGYLQNRENLPAWERALAGFKSAFEALEEIKRGRK